jgi:hypothetical protein
MGAFGDHSLELGFTTVDDRLTGERHSFGDDCLGPEEGIFALIGLSTWVAGNLEALVEFSLQLLKRSHLAPYLLDAGSRASVLRDFSILHKPRLEFF